MLLHGGVSPEEFGQIKGLVWQRNTRIVRITSMLAALMGLVFMITTLISGSGMWVPYFVLLVGSALINALSGPAEKIGSIFYSMLLCYGEMLLVCTYAAILSTQASNYAIPATSVVVFIVLLPITIDDSALRMFLFMMLESGGYLTVSYFLKSPEAYKLDLTNVITFYVVGVIIYSVISTRNIREIHKGVRIDSIQKNIISSMATVVEERDEGTGGHIMRTEEYVRMMIEKMKKIDKYSSLNEEFYNNMLLAAPMHDIGKLKIPDAILNKPAKLSDDEYRVMKKHSEYGADIISRTMKDIEEEDYFSVACNIAKYHHERFDGTGYPEGLKGEDIPIEARVMAIADVYDALTSERPYKKAFSKEESRRIIRDGSGSQFDPELASLFLECL